MIQKQTANATLVTGHQADPALCYKFYFYSEYAVHCILQYYFGTGEDNEKPESIPGDTIISDLP